MAGFAIRWIQWSFGGTFTDSSGQDQRSEGVVFQRPLPEVLLQNNPHATFKGVW